MVTDMELPRRAVKGIKGRSWNMQVLDYHSSTHSSFLTACSTECLEKEHHIHLIQESQSPMFGPEL